MNRAQTGRWRQGRVPPLRASALTRARESRHASEPLLLPRALMPVALALGALALGMCVVSCGPQPGGSASKAERAGSTTSERPTVLPTGRQTAAAENQSLTVSATGRDFRIAYPAEKATFARAVGESLPAAVVRIAALRPGWEPSLTVYIARNSADATTRIGHAADGTAAAALADGIDAHTGAPRNPRVVITPEAEPLSGQDLTALLTHELFHLATTPVLGGTEPLWLTEGAAQAVAVPLPLTAAGEIDSEAALRLWERQAPTTARHLRSGPAPTALPSNADFAGDPAARRTAYDYSWAFVAWFAASYGEPVLMQLFEAAVDNAVLARGTANLAATAGELGIEGNPVDRWLAWMALAFR